MHVHRIVFERNPHAVVDDAATDAIERLLGAWHTNGQVCGSQWPIVPHGDGLAAIVLTPEPGSLDARWNRRHVTATLDELARLGLAVRHESMGEDPTSASGCTCPSPSAYALYTTYISLESPVRCLDCFQPVALHRFEPVEGHEHYPVIGWQSDYRSCDSLQMNCTVLERAATREISLPDSALSRRGRALCESFTAMTGSPFYYYLYRSGGRSARAEADRPCPGCGAPWKLAERQHLFDFRCDACRLLSNVSFSMR